MNNPDLLAVTPLSANQVQISAKKAGVTQVNLWDEDGQIHTVDILIYGDVKELEVALQTQYPNSSIKVYRYSESLVLKGFTDQPEHVSQIVQLASDYAPKIINNITVGGVQQVLLKVRVMEVSRTKLRQLGVDWAYARRQWRLRTSIASREILQFDSFGGGVAQAALRTTTILCVWRCQRRQLILWLPSSVATAEHRQDSRRAESRCRQRPPRSIQRRR